MPLLDASDIAALLELGGDTAAVAGSPVPVLFDKPSNGQGLFSGEVSGDAPEIILATETAKARGVSYGSPVTFDGEQFYCLTVEHDGEGLTRCTLTREAPDRG